MKLRTTIPSLLLTLLLLAASTISPVMAAIGDNPDGPFYPVKTGSSGGISAMSVTYGACGPIDLALVVDDTGSMGGAISNIAAELPSIITSANTASGDDLKVGFVTFKDDINVRSPLTSDIAGVSAIITDPLQFYASGGAGNAEASDQAKRSVINNFAAGTWEDANLISGTQVGSFTEAWRSTAMKIAVLITDSPPGGFNDAQDIADVTALTVTYPAEAFAKGIKFSDVFVPTYGDYGQKAMLQADAAGTGGVFVETAADGAGTGAAIEAIISACGGTGDPTVPEFPSVALPIMAVLGIMFLMSRKKEN